MDSKNTLAYKRLWKTLIFPNCFEDDTFFTRKTFSVSSRISILYNSLWEGLVFRIDFLLLILALKASWLSQVVLVPSVLLQLFSLLLIAAWLHPSQTFLFILPQAVCCHNMLSLSFFLFTFYSFFMAQVMLFCQTSWFVPFQLFLPVPVFDLFWSWIHFSLFLGSILFWETIMSAGCIVRFPYDLALDFFSAN